MKETGKGEINREERETYHTTKEKSRPNNARQRAGIALLLFSQPQI